MKQDTAKSMIIDILITTHVIQDIIKLKISIIHNKVLEQVNI